MSEVKEDKQEAEDTPAPDQNETDPPAQQQQATDADDTKQEDNVEDKDVPMPHPDVQEVQDTTEAMQEAMLRMKEMQAKVEQVEKTHAESLLLMKKTQAEQEKRLQAEQQRCATLEAEQKKQKTEQLHKARKDKNNAFAELQKCLSSYKTYNGPLTVPNSESEQEQLVAEKGLASAAITAIVEAEEKKSNMESENNSLKRKQSDMKSSLGNFGGVPVLKAAQVNASAEHAGEKRFAHGGGDLSAWRQQNPDATWRQVNAMFLQMQKPSNVKTGGIVNASKHQWTASAIQENDKPTNIASCCSAKDLQRELFDTIMNMNTGRMIDVNETTEMINGINTQNARQY